jgi:hypothetical protein
VAANWGFAPCAACVLTTLNAIGAAIAASATNAISVSVTFDLIRPFINVSPHLGRDKRQCNGGSGTISYLKSLGLTEWLWMSQERVKINLPGLRNLYIPAFSLWLLFLANLLQW